MLVGEGKAPANYDTNTPNETSPKHRLYVHYSSMNYDCYKSHLAAELSSFLWEGEEEAKTNRPSFNDTKAKGEERDSCTTFWEKKKTEGGRRRHWPKE